MEGFSNPFSSLTSSSSFKPSENFTPIGGTSSAGGLVGGIIGAIGNIIIGGLNYSLQKKQYEWQKRAWKQQMAREDNAMQRRVLDLQNAGLNPVLAAGGSGAGSSGAPQISAPNLQLDLAEQALMVMNLVQGQKNIAKTVAETQLLNKQKSLTSANAQKQWQDNKINRESGTVSSPSPYGSMYRDTRSVFEKLLDKIMNKKTK